MMILFDPEQDDVLPDEPPPEVIRCPCGHVGASWYAAVLSCNYCYMILEDHRAEASHDSLGLPCKKGGAS